MAGCIGATFCVPQKIPNSYATPGFCTWYAIAALAPEYNINSMCIKEIKALYSNRKNSKKIYLKGMNELIEVESEASRMRATATTEPEEEATEEPFIRRLQSVISKRPRPQFTEAGSSSSQKRARREHVIEALPEEASRLKARLESTL